MKRFLLGLLVALGIVGYGGQAFAGNATNSSGAGQATGLVVCDESIEEVDDFDLRLGGNVDANFFSLSGFNACTSNACGGSDDCVKCLNFLQELGLTVTSTNPTDAVDDDTTSYLLEGIAQTVADRLPAGCFN